MALTPEQIHDFANLTLKNYKTKSWSDIALEHQFYCYKKMVDKHKVQEKGGPLLNFKLKTKNTGNARVSGLFDQDQTKVDDNTIEAEVKWSKQTTNWSYDVDEDFFQSDELTIINELQIREHSCMSDMAELQEQLLWGAPTGTTDKSPMGIPFWMQKNTATTHPDGGFHGGNPAGFSGGAAGVDSALYPRWQNWTFGYTAVSRDDMVRKVKKAIRNTEFVAPIPHPELGFGKSNYEIFTTERVLEPLERLAETRNDNLGNDVAKYMNQVVIASVPVMWVPYLTNTDLDDPIYGINWSVFHPFVKKNGNMRRMPEQVAPKQHAVRTIHIDNWSNYLCYNRRKTFVGSLSS